MAAKKYQPNPTDWVINKSTMITVAAVAGYLFMFGVAWQRFVQVEEKVSGVEGRVQAIETNKFDTGIKLVEMSAKLSELSRSVDKMVLQVETLTKK